MVDDLKLITPKEWFETWRDPRDFYRAADECMGQFEPYEILAMSGVQHLFDAFVAGRFARIWNDHHPCQVRLVSDEFPDAQLRGGNGTMDFEITMADRKDRRMAVEHRALWEKQQRGELAAEPIDRDADRAHALEAIPRMCRTKVKKYLGKEASDHRVSASLLIYVNFSSLWGPVVSDEEMIELTAPWKDNFEAIWLLNGARIFRAWPAPCSLTAVNNPIN